MKAATVIREKLGLTQHQLANYLGVSRSLLVMHEKNKRELPTAAFLKLCGIELFLTAHDKKTNAVLPHEKRQLERAQQILVKFDKEYEYKKLATQRQLEKIQKAYQQKIDLWHFVSHLDTHKSLSTNENHWLQLMKLEALKGIEKNGLHEQLKLELDLKAIEVKREFISEKKQ